VDGFAEFSEQELNLLAALVPCCEEATLTFCLDRVPLKETSWLSNWSVVRRSFETCKKRLSSLAEASVSVEVLRRDPAKSRFLDNPVLQHLETHWARPEPYQAASPSSESRSLGTDPLASQSALDASLRVAICADPDAEVTLAAREVLSYVRDGGRYRDVTVLVRKLEGYHEPLQRLFSRYGIPFFLDRREPVSHHPLAELTRSALRTVATQWMRDDWFAALKTGLVPAEEREIDELENEALARGWRGSVWHQPLRLREQPRSPADLERLRALEGRLETLRQRLMPPFQQLALALTRQSKPSGPQLAGAVREFWKALNVEERLQQWAATEMAGAGLRIPNSVHATVWEQMNAWAANVELAFATETLPLREWLPILDAGLSGLSVGVIPPALDQVLIGAIDRSRNPDIKLALVLGLNETVFPALPEATVLLTEADRVELERRNFLRSGTTRQQLGRERYHAYIACTRARQRVVLTSALHDANGAPLNPSPFLAQVRQLFPSLEPVMVPQAFDWRESTHASELIGPLLALQGRSRESGETKSESRITHHASRIASHTPPSGLALLASLPAIASVLERLRSFHSPELEEKLSPELAGRLYGPVLRTSVSRMEQFAACPFKFFVYSGLRAEERKRFELDVKEQGSFQHDALALFHQELHRENKRWRDTTPSEARERIARIAKGLTASYREGLLEATEETRFMARILTESLEDFVETLVGWMRHQYLFDPVAVELPFGEDERSPAWRIAVAPGNENSGGPAEAAAAPAAHSDAGAPGEAAGPGPLSLEIYGRIDRVDLYHEPDSDEALCVVVDYKSSRKQLDPVLMAHGLQLQLLTYLNVLRHWPNPGELFGAARLIPAGVFYVSLRGKYAREKNRRDALENTGQARNEAYRHAGRFDARFLRLLDSRPDALGGDQFNYRLTKSGQVYKSSREALDAAEFQALLDSVETNLKKMGREIFSGEAKVAPYRKGAATACEQCDYRSICRIDPWTHRYRVLKLEEEK
jgi:ATP-dependent helicase/nuclease subunit B